MQPGEVGGLTPGMRWAGIVLALPALLVLGHALLRLDRMLRACAEGHLTLLLICALFFVVASLMHEARRIAEDNEGFV